MNINKTINSRLESLEYTEQPDSLWLSLPCANLIDGGSGQVAHCSQPATLFCSKCRLVKYCSKKCQNSHWKEHKKACNHPLRSPAWKPAWEVEGREPSFVIDDPPANIMEQQNTFGRKTYLWENTPAADYLQLRKNEGSAAVDQDLKLCFAASGDIRNLIKTVNGLPENYRGKCDIYFNDKEPLVTNHNLVALFALLNPDIPLDRAVDLAIHLTYSSALTPAMARDFYQCITAIYANPPSSLCWSGELPTRGLGKLRFTQLTTDTLDILQTYLSNYPLRDALQGMREIMMSPQRVDYRHKHMLVLKSEHRLPYEYYRNMGIISPFSVDTTTFTEPNRTIFDQEGRWLSMDSTNPLYGWHMTDVCASSKKYNIDVADIYGCFFYYLKDEFEKFAKRVQNCNVNIYITQFEAHTLSKMIRSWTNQGGNISQTVLNIFDRIDTSNIIDYVGIEPILDDWGPLLNRRNPHAVLSAASMNWYVRDPDAQALNQPDFVKSKLQELMKLLGISYQSPSRGNPEKLQYGVTYNLMLSIGMLHDDGVPFQAYLGQEHAESAARQNKLQIRQRRRIRPKRLGHRFADGDKMPTYTPARVYDVFTLGGGEPEIRFLEFENLSAS
ncbi:hypothetical protein BDN72DRAFT_841402 [Pluteus cervinus]|uniref:Uncharacterized protein n=1 Tax=Pluteus cervinus TaxID=181527 RepID=A0ACD3AT36_9AGAR|nr:hypothetical protein BDN72DRAFT_841402 [Pluteus cervinus]